MSRHEDVPVVLDTGEVVYLPGSTLVRCDKPPPRGLGGKRRDPEALVALRTLRRDVGPGPRVVAGDSDGRIEGYVAEARRLRTELAEALAKVAALEEMRATWTRAVVNEILDG